MSRGGPPGGPNTSPPPERETPPAPPEKHVTRPLTADETRRIVERNPDW